MSAVSVSEPGVRPILAEAVDLARRALLELQPEGVGEHLGVTAEDEYAATHHFATTLPGYRGWQWAVVVAAPPEAERATVSESALLPGPDALVAPDFVPWERRVRPGDLAPGDLLAPLPDDPRLVPGYLVTGDPVVDDVCEELGQGRPQVLSREGREEAAERWFTEFGPDTEMARAAPSTCRLCGFYVPLAGALRAAYGVCANALGADGHVVHAEYGCGAHSDTELPTGGGSPLYEAYDDAAVELISPEDLRKPSASGDTTAATGEDNVPEPPTAPGTSADQVAHADVAGSASAVVSPADAAGQVEQGNGPGPTVASGASAGLVARADVAGAASVVAGVASPADVVERDNGPGPENIGGAGAVDAGARESSAEPSDVVAQQEVSAPPIAADDDAAAVEPRAALPTGRSGTTSAVGPGEHSAAFAPDRGTAEVPATTGTSPVTDPTASSRRDSVTGIAAVANPAGTSEYSGSTAASAASADESRDSAGTAETSDTDPAASSSAAQNVSSGHQASAGYHDAWAVSAVQVRHRAEGSSGTSGAS